MIRLALSAAVVVLLSPMAAAAQERLILRCSAVATGVSFGVFSGSRVDAAGSISVTCSGIGSGNIVTVALSEGGSHTFLDRFMFNGVNELHYNLYTDGAFTNIWGNGLGETHLKLLDFDFGLIGNVTRSASIFGRVPFQALPRAGHYSDLIIATVAF